MSWTKEVEVAKAVDELISSWSIEGRDFPDFEMLDVKIASALKRSMSNQYVRKRLDVEEQKAHAQDRILRERQIAHLIYEHFGATGAHDAALDCDLQGRKINFTNTKTLVGWCRDQTQRALPLTCPNVKTLKTKNEKKRKQRKMKYEEKRKQKKMVKIRGTMKILKNTHKRSLQGVPHQRRLKKKLVKKKVTRNREAVEVKKIGKIKEKREKEKEQN